MFEPSQILDIAFNQAPRQAMNAAFAIIRALLPTSAEKSALAQLVTGGGATGAGVPQGAISTVNVPANSVAWIDSGVTFTGSDALWLEASGAICHNSTDALYGPYNATGAYLTWVLVADGSTPTGDVGGQNDFRLRATAHRKAGRLWLRIRDVGGNGDNAGSFDVKIHRFTDPSQALAPLSEIGGLRDTITALTARVAALEAG